MAKNDNVGFGANAHYFDVAPSGIRLIALIYCRPALADEASMAVALRKSISDQSTKQLQENRFSFISAPGKLVRGVSRRMRKHLGSWTAGGSRRCFALLPFVLLVAILALPEAGFAQQLGGSGSLNQLQQMLGNGTNNSLGNLGSTPNSQQDMQDVIQRPVLPIPASALPTSRLEQIISTRAGARLNQFGYEQLGVSRSVAIPQAGAIQDDYILGSGDEIIVSLRGQENGELRVTVDRSGQVLLPRLAPLAAGGRTFGAFRESLEAEVRRAYISTNAVAAIAKVRQISVLVSGEVNVPGQRTVSGLSSVVDAILLSGGIRKTGSLRSVRIERGGKSFTVDLYSVLTDVARSGPMRLADGDRVLVPPLQKTVTVSGFVRQPGIFELPSGASSISARSLMALAGGPEVRGRYRLSVLQIAASGSSQMVDLENDKAAIRDSEILFIQLGADLTSSQATLAGGTGLAGQYPIVTGTRLSDLLKAPGALGPAPYTLFGIIARKDSHTLLRQLIPFTPVSVINRSEDVPLQGDDIVRILSVNEVRLLTNTVRSYVQRQTIQQDNIRNPLSAAGQPPAPPMPSAGAGGAAAFATAINAQATQNAILNGSPNAQATISDLQRNDIAGLATQVDPVTQQGLDAQMAAQQQQQAIQQAQQQQRQQENASLYGGPYQNQFGPLSGGQGIAVPPASLAAGQVQPPAALPQLPNIIQPPPALNFQSVDANSGLIASNREISNFGDLARQLGVDQLVLVNFLIDHQAVLNGAVSGPGSYFVGPNVALQDLVAAAGGTTNWADESGVELISTAVDVRSGHSATQRAMLPLRQGTLANYIVHPRDQFRFNQVFTDAGLGSATVQGEIRFSGTYQITRGERLSDLLGRAGGLTSTSYPMGTVFLRKSAAATEHEGYVRAAAEIENQLVVAMTHIGNDKIDPATFASMQAFVNELRNQKAVGRVAIVADPSVLASKPELDPLLEAGDVVYIPQRPTTVSVLGQVMQPGSFPYRPGLTLAGYVDQAGGYAATSDESLTFIVLPDGSARRMKKSWLSFDAESLPPGSTIVVPRDVTPLDTRQLILDVSQIFSQLAVSIASVAVISR